MTVIESNVYGAHAENDSDYNELAAQIENLAAELALCPVTYFAISELFSCGRQCVTDQDMSRTGEGAPPTDVTEETVWEDMSTYDEEGLFMQSMPVAVGAALDLSPDIARYLGSTL